MIFWTKFAQKWYFWSKTEKVNIILPDFSLKWQVFIFWTQFSQKGYSQSKIEKLVPWLIWICWIQWWYTIKFSIFKLVKVPYFTLNWQFLTFWTKLAHKGYFQSKTDKVNTIIEFCIFKLVYVPNFSLNWQCFIFWTKFAQKG